MPVPCQFQKRLLFLGKGGSANGSSQKQEMWFWEELLARRWSVSAVCLHPSAEKPEKETGFSVYILNINIFSITDGNEFF